MRPIGLNITEMHKSKHLEWETHNYVNNHLVIRY